MYTVRRIVVDGNGKMKYAEFKNDIDNSVVRATKENIKANAGKIICSNAVIDVNGIIRAKPGKIIPRVEENVVPRELRESLDMLEYIHEQLMRSRGINAEVAPLKKMIEKNKAYMIWRETMGDKPVVYDIQIWETNKSLVVQKRLRGSDGTELGKVQYTGNCNYIASIVGWLI